MADHVGQQLGNYRVIRQIGRGGFAHVYLGEHIYLKTQVAIKLVQSQVGNEEDLESFLKEARTIASLIHPNIIRVMDFGVDGETPFLVMDYAPNGTLRQRHPKGTQLALTTILPYVKQIAAALQHAHNEKLIHRDVKPENMLLGRNNDVLLSDFGIALIAQSSLYQSTQDVIGTVAYMSPEQIQGKPRPASDQYSLGIVVYEWLSGGRPFHGSFTELCTQHIMAPPPPLHEKIPTISPDVEHVVLTTLAKDPKQRFGSMQAFVNALEQASQAELPAFVKPQSGFPPPTAPSPAPPEPVKSGPLPSMRAEPSSQPLPIQHTGNSSLQEALRSASDNIPAEEKPVAEMSDRKVDAAEGKDEKANVWRIGRRQVGAMLVGVVLSVIVFLLAYQLSQGLGAPLLFLLSVLVPLFFGTVFGSWVGLVTGGGGAFLISLLLSSFPEGFSSYSSYIFGFDFTIGSAWFYVFGFAAIGFVAGLAFLLTKGRYNTWRAIALAVVFCLIGPLMMDGAAQFAESNWGGGISSQDVLAYFLPAVVPGLILLPILLVLYRAIVSRRTRNGKAL